MDQFLNEKIIYKIPRREWTTLRDLYRRNWPKHILSFYSLKTYIEWIQENSAYDIIIYTTDENWEKHGTYVLVEVNGPRCNVLFNTLDASKSANQMLKALKFLPENKAFTMAAFVDQVRFIVENYFSELDLYDFARKCCDTVLFYLPQKEALDLPIQPKPNYHLKPLTQNDTKLIDSLWPHQYPGSDVFIQNVIRHNLTLGAYEEKSGKLCGWVMQEQVGTIGLLQVLNSYKRQGLGELLVMQMAVLMARAGMDSTATVMITNRPSRHLFQKLGFKIIDRAYWYDKIVKQPPIIEKARPNFSELLLEGC